MNGDHGSAEFKEGSGNPGIPSQWTEAREDGGGGGMLERGREGVEWKGGWDGDRRLLNALGRTAEGKRGRQWGSGVRTHSNVCFEQERAAPQPCPG
jgi:hypothetical protein